MLVIADLNFISFPLGIPPLSGLPMDFPFVAVYSNGDVDVGVDKEKEEARSFIEGTAGESD